MAYSIANRYPVPSAPYAPPVNAAQEPFSLQDECSICLEKFKDKPARDKNAGLVLAEAECGHRVHEFCMKELNNSDLSRRSECPVCTRPLGNVKLIPIVNKSKRVQRPLQQASNARVQNVQRQSQTSAETAKNERPAASSLAQQAQGVCMSVLNGSGRLLSGIFHAFTDESERSVQARKMQIEQRIVILNGRNNKLPVLFNREKESMQIALSCVESLINKESRKALKAIKLLEDHFNAFENGIKRQRDILLNEMNRFQEQLKKPN